MRKLLLKTVFYNKLKSVVIKEYMSREYHSTSKSCMIWYRCAVFNNFLMVRILGSIWYPCDVFNNFVMVRNLGSIWYPCVVFNYFLMVRKLGSVPTNTCKNTKLRFLGFGFACFVYV